MKWPLILNFKSMIHQLIHSSKRYFVKRFFFEVSLIRAQINRLCACYHESRWFRCRILQISPDFSTVTVVYLDWGMTIPMSIGPESIRRLPNEFYSEPACSIMCHLDGVPDSKDSISSELINQCIALLSENEYEVTVNGYDSTTGGKIVLAFNGRIINDQIRQLLVPHVDHSFLIENSEIEILCS